MDHRLILPCIFSCMSSFSFVSSNAQADYADKVTSLKNQFPKEEVVAYQHKEIVNFSLNQKPAPGEGKVKATVTTQITLVPVKDYIKYEDGLFYNQQISIDNIRATNSKGKEVLIQKQCTSYN